MTNLFNQETPGNVDNNPEGSNPQGAPQNTPYDTLLDSIKNEKGERKYRNVEEALKGLAHAQSYIPELKNEFNATKAELQAVHERLKKTDELERIVAEMAKRQERNQETPGQVFDESKIAELVDTRLTYVKTAEQQRNNQSVVRDSLIQTFGDKAAEVFNSKAVEFGMTPEEFTALAGRSPKAVLTMFGVSGSDAPKQSTQAPFQGTVRSESFQGKKSSLIGDREAFILKPGHGAKDTEALLERSAQLLEELQETEGVGIHDLTDPKVYFKYFG